LLRWVVSEAFRFTFEKACKALAAFNLDPGHGQGVWAHSDHGEGVHGETNADNYAAVAEFNFGNGIAVYGESRGQGPAGFFKGNVVVTGDIFLQNADCAEDFDLSGTEKIEAGTVMVLDQEGALEPSRRAYDKRVAGVISGAGDYKPGITLDKQQSSKNRMPVALVGKVYCKVDAQCAPVEVGDLLTTSSTPGYAMKAQDPLLALGAIIGKALRSLRAGRGLIPILVALQ
jgi:hypothetical protein